MGVLLFAGPNYYPGGGWWDFAGEFPDAAAARARFAEMQATHTGPPSRFPDWAHIAQDGAIIAEWSYSRSLGDYAWGPSEIDSDVG